MVINISLKINVQLVLIQLQSTLHILSRDNYLFKSFFLYGKTLLIRPISVVNFIKNNNLTSKTNKIKSISYEGIGSSISKTMAAISPNSSITHNPVSYLNKTWKNASSWLDSKRNDDNAEGLWRVNDTLYDLTSFIGKHPGGRDWLTLTKGTDITEAFQTHHLNMEKVNPVLEKYRVREATKTRNYKLTFEENGFYQTLKRRVNSKLGETNVKKIRFQTNLMSDLLLFGVFAAAILTTKNIWFLALTSPLLAWLTIAGHNYVHRKDNFRMNYFNFSLLSHREFRVSHALSHHLYTNSLVDMEVLVLEPLICWIPNPKIKGFINRYVAWIYGPIVWSLFWISDVIGRIIGLFLVKENLITIADFIPFTLPAAMYFFGQSNDILTIFKLWMIIICTSSFLFTITGIHAGHHHPLAFHDGDIARDNLDWGLFQVDTMVERRDIQGNHFMVLTNFGDHALHHLFPTLDHGVLNDLYPLLYETMEEFKVQLKFQNFFQLVKGQHQQVARITCSDRLSNKE